MKLKSFHWTRQTVVYALIALAVVDGVSGDIGDYAYSLGEEIELASDKSASDIEITVEELLDFGIDVDQVIQRRC